jgi:hypothetical protein
MDIKIHNSNTDPHATLSNDFAQRMRLFAAILALMGVDPSARRKTGYTPTV